MAKIAKSTDLTKLEGDPGARADVDHIPLEGFEFRGWVKRRRVEAGIELRTRTIPRSALGTAIATVVLVLGGCIATGVLAAVGAPVWAACCGLLVVPASLFFGLRWIGGRRANRAGRALDAREDLPQ